MRTYSTVLAMLASVSVTACVAFEGEQVAANDQVPRGVPVLADDSPVVDPTVAYPQQPARLGMTWGKAKHWAEFGIDAVSCHGRPRIADGSTKGGSCNAYTGDTSCRVSLPMLCLKTDGSPRPAYPTTGKSHAMEKAYYRGWAAGHIALTPAVQGTLLSSPQAADAMCVSYFGPGYRMASHHDGKYMSGMDGQKFAGESWPSESGQLRTGGWSWYAYGNIRDDSRFWVKIADQKANCWD